MSGDHSILAPSSSEIWTRCTAQPKAVEGLPNPPTEASALGTAKHQVSYWCLTHSDPTMTPTKAGLLGAIECADGFSFTVDEEFIEHVEIYLKTVRALPGQGWYELPVEHGKMLGTPGQKGTSDCAKADRPNRTLYVVDAKFGYHKVEVIKNRQMTNYAAGVLSELDEFGTDFDKVVFVVSQPKQGDLPFIWETTAEWVRATMAEWAPGAQAALAGKGVFAPGTWCTASYCLNRHRCKALADSVLMDFPVDGQAEALGAPDPITPPSALDVKALAHYLDQIDHIEAWCRAIREEALKRAVGGEEIPGYKVIEGRKGNRKWGDVGMVTDLASLDVGEAAYQPRELKTPAQLEKAYKKAGLDFSSLAGFIDQSAGAPSLARMTEPGEALPKVEFGLEETT